MKCEICFAFGRALAGATTLAANSTAGVVSQRLGASLGNVQGESLKAAPRVSLARFQTPALPAVRASGPEKPNPVSHHHDDHQDLVALATALWRF
jgi:hypothetical protein